VEGARGIVGMIIRELQEIVEVNPRFKGGQPLLTDDPVSFIPMAAISEHSKKIVLVEQRSYGEVAKGYTYFEEGDVIVAKITPCFENGKMALVTGLPYPVAFGSTEFHVFRASEYIINSYLFHLLQTPAIQSNGATLMKGAAGQKRVPADYFKTLKIPVPTITEQKRIVKILDAANTLRTKRRESLAQLDTLLQSTFLHMFGDPVTNPMGWEVVKFQSIGSSRLGKMLDKGKQVGDRQFPYLANFNVQWGRFEIAELRCMDFTEAERKEFELQKGDLLICEGGEVGRTAIWQGEHNNIYFQKALHRVRLNSDISIPEYVQYFMWFMAQNGGFRDFTNSATIAHLTGMKLKTLPFPCPPLNLQRHFATIVESVEQQKARVRTHLAELDALFASLQARAFNGEL
jgi:type I restriction enzyme S subunit